MAIDPSIYGAIQAPVAPNPLADFAQISQIQGLQNQNRLASLAFQDRERALADEAAQRDAVKGFGDDTTANYNRLLQTGNLKAAQDYRKQVDDGLKTRSDVTKTGVETGSKAFDLYRTQLGTAQDPNQAAALVTAAYHDPVVGPLMQRYGSLEDGLGRLQQALAQPNGFAQWKANAAIGIEKLAELAKTQNVNLGGTMQTQVVQPATGQVSVVGSAPITQSADNAATNATSRSNNSATVGAMRDNAQATRDAASISTGFKNQAELRKEFEGLPEIKNYKQAFPAYTAIKDAASRNSTQADINLVYGIAKLYDPNSVVREGEYATVANSPNIPERIKGFAQYLAGGGRLTDTVKKQILAEAEGRIGSFKAEAAKTRGSYDEIARRNGIDPSIVFQSVGDIQGAGPAITPSAPTSGGVRKYNPATGRIE